MTEDLTKQSIGVGVAGTGFIGPAHVEALRRNSIQVLGWRRVPKGKPRKKLPSWEFPAPMVLWRTCWPIPTSTWCT